MPDWENLETVRHISVRLSMWNPATLGVGICRYEKLRTLLFLPRFEIHGLSIFVLRDLFSKLKLLRVLGLRHCEIKEVPESIGDMKHLRYLDLSGNPLLRHLPESLGDLYNLQTLKVEGCGSLRALPARTSELTNLRHLQADDELVSDIDGLGKLTNLEELSVRGRKVRELGGMSMLRKLSIWNLEEVESKEEVLQIRLKRMECLEVLRLEWSAQRQRGPMPMNSEVAAVEEEEGVLQALQPNGNSIQELRIWGYMGARSPNWMEAPTVGSFSGLRYVVVGCCPNWKALPSSLSQLPVLESLVITSMPRWEEWDGDHSNSHQDPCSDTPYFPCLRELQIVDCPKLGELLLLPPKLRNLRLEKVGLSHLPGLRGH
ncbi:hypothetical protein Taro_001608, partial [Colocasia esculenta]|nr:hypothetical protein [Colocasia esculenta]